MPAWPEPLRFLFARAATRVRLLALANGASAALALCVPLLIARWTGALSPSSAIIVAGVVVVIAMAWAAWTAPRRPEALAALIEARTPIARNVLVTAAEVLSRQTPVRADVREVVLHDAADAAGRIDLVALLPARRAAVTLLIALALWAAGVSTGGAFLVRARDLVLGPSSGAPEISRLAVTVTPPAYTGKPAAAAIDPQHLEVMAGSTIRVDVETNAAHVDLMSVGERHALTRERDGRFRGGVTATADGFLAVQPFGPDESAGVRRVISLAVLPDRPPLARIVTPGKDLFLAVATSAIPFSIEAADDLGLASLRLTYTKVTGGGENFEFKDGEFPLQITRDRPDAWSAAGTLALPSLGLEPGDLLVYRALVGDTRPGAAPIESDAFVIQMLLAGEAMAEGLSIDEERDTYALSQQMIIIKTQRLIAKKATMPAEAFADAAMTLAAEQRKVRAEFIFMIGGEFEDMSVSASGDINEEEEAANEVEIAAGRLQNSGRSDILLATRRMSDAARALTNIDPVKALPDEKAAVVALQRAFARSRYILRVLTPRERIDETRRLSGRLTAAPAWRRPVADAAGNPRAAALLAALSKVARVAALAAYGPAEANQLAGITESILRVDGSLAPVAQAFQQAAAAIAAGRPASETSALIDTAAVKLSAATRLELAPAPEFVDPSASRVRGALADALRRAGGRR